MPVLIRIAFRNLIEHKSKTLIIGGLLALGVAILIVGNSFMDTAAQGVKDTFTANYTGDIFISGRAKGTVSLFGVQAAGGQEDTPILPYRDKIEAKLASMRDVSGYTGQVSGFGIASVSDSDEQSFTLLFGIQPDSYRKLFSEATINQGHFLSGDEEGLIISQATLDRFNKSFKRTLKIGDTITLTSMGKSGFKIRTVPIAGVISYKVDSSANDYISYVDVNTLRLINGLTVGGDEDTVISDDQKALLSASDEDAMFGSETLVHDNGGSAQAAEAAAAASAAPKKLKAAVADPGAWQFELVRVKNPLRTQRVVSELNAWFAANKIDAQAGDWKAAAGPFSQSIDVIRIVFDIAIIIIAVVAIIIMMNTLVISVMERTGEIGTMRALGAQKGFVRSMFFIETLSIALVFGCIGTLLAFATVGILNACNIQATNDFFKILFAGKTLHTAVNPVSILSSLVLMVLTAVIAHLYPVSLALKIEPVTAMQTAE